jgi:hypothetical protein
VASDLYCDRGDVNACVPAGEITGWARVAASAIASNDVITLEGHGLDTDDTLPVRAAEGGALPAPLAEVTVYYAIRLTNATFKVAASAGGAAINLTADGAQVIVIKEPDYNVAIEEWSRWVDTFLPAHAVPLSTPLGDDFALVRRHVAKLAAYDLFRLDGKASQTFDAVKADAMMSLQRLATGIPIRGGSGARTNLAITSTLSADTSDPRGWGSGTIP